MVSIDKRLNGSRTYVDSPPPGSRRSSATYMEDGGLYGCDSSGEEDEESYGVRTHQRVSSSSSNEFDKEDFNTVEVVFNKIYLDPLQEVMESIDAEAAAILRTGKLTVHGEAGDMNIVQPLLFSLQAKDEELQVLLPQLLQNPLFTQKEGESFSSTTITADTLLQNGCIRLGVMVDHVIYKLLATHCCKGPGARQAETLIESALKTAYSLPTALQRFEANCKNPPPIFLSGYTTVEPETIMSDEEIEEEMEVFSKNSSNHLDVHSACPKTSRSSGVFSTYTSSSSIKHASIAEEDIMSSLPPVIPESRTRAGSLRYSKSPSRKNSTVMPPAFNRSQSELRRESNMSETSSTSSLRILQDSTTWHATLPYPGDMIVGSFGDNTYPILIWNSDLKVTFKLGVKNSSTSSTLIMDNPKELLKLNVVNTTSHKIAFSIRSHRQSMLFRSHVIFPKAGLHLLEPQQEWSIEAEFIRASEQDQDEYICIDLLVCQLNSSPSWNILRRYAVLKQSQDQHKLIKKLSRGMDPVILPGSFASNKDLGNSLKQLILHGLQCVVKNKLDQAEVIFTHALYLPLFQRVPLKAFAYICLAVTANKRRKKGENMNKVSSVLKLVNSMDKLIEACESAPNMRMPKTIGLIKQLKKELNPAKVIKDQRQTLKKRASVRNETSKEVYPTGDALDLYNISLMIPGGAVPKPTTITLGHLNQEEIHQSIQNSAWSSMLTILGTISIHCSPPVERFSKPVVATIILPHDVAPSTPLSANLRLLQSNYMSTWIDITDNPSTEVTLESNRRLTVRTDHTGWLVVASLQLDLSKIMPIAIKSVFSEELVMMDINVYGYIFPDDTHAQISVFITPHQENPTSSGGKETPPGHRQIAFPHTFKVYKNQKVQIKLHGQFEPDTEAGQTSLQADRVVDGDMTQIVEKTIKISPETKGLYGKLTLSTFCSSHKEWDRVHEMNLSSPSSAHNQT